MKNDACKKRNLCFSIFERRFTNSLPNIFLTISKIEIFEKFFQTLFCIFFTHDFLSIFRLKNFEIIWQNSILTFVNFLTKISNCKYYCKILQKCRLFFQAYSITKSQSSFQQIVNVKKTYCSSKFYKYEKLNSVTFFARNLSREVQKKNSWKNRCISQSWKKKNFLIRDRWVWNASTFFFKYVEHNFSGWEKKKTI